MSHSSGQLRDSNPPPIRSLEHRIVLELLYTEDASETELIVKSGSVDVGLGIAVMRVLRAYAKTR